MTHISPGLGRTGPDHAGPDDAGPGGAEQDADNVRAAIRLRRQRPEWVIVWSAPLRRFSACPLFRAPSPGQVTAH
jgi:hypothetical protein